MTLKVKFDHRFKSRTHTSFKNYILSKHLFNFHSGSEQFMHGKDIEEDDTDSDESLLPVAIVNLSKRHAKEQDGNAATSSSDIGSSSQLPDAPSTSQQSSGSSGRKYLQCLYCDKVFNHRGDLNKHLRTHSGEKPYVCPYPQCGKRFAHSSNLRRHIVVHSGDKPFCCDKCGKCFNRKDKLLLHQQTRLCKKRSFMTKHQSESKDS